MLHDWCLLLHDCPLYSWCPRKNGVLYHILHGMAWHGLVGMGMRALLHLHTGGYNLANWLFVFCSCSALYSGIVFIVMRSIWTTYIFPVAQRPSAFDQLTKSW